MTIDGVSLGERKKSCLHLCIVPGARWTHLMWIKWILGPGRRMQMGIGVAETRGYKVGFAHPNSRWISHESLGTSVPVSFNSDQRFSYKILVGTHLIDRCPSRIVSTTEIYQQRT